MTNRRKKREEVYRWLKEYIQQNTFSTNVKLPSENALCSQFQVSRTTVREALQLLMEEDLIYTLRGSGTYINKATTTAMEVVSQAPIKIGAILQGQDKHANVAFIEGLRSVFDSQKVNLQLYFTDNNFSNERACLESVSNQSFAGFVVDGVKSVIHNPNLDYYQTLLSDKIPVVFYNNYYAALPFPRITIDNAGCAEQLIAPVLQAGHSRIASIFWCDNQQSLEKFAGFATVLHRHGAQLHDEDIYWMLSHEAASDEFEKKIIKFLKSNPQCTAIACCNRMVYQSVKQALSRMGKTIPHDYAVVCFDYSAEDWEAEGVSCSIHPGFALGHASAKALLDMIANGDYHGSQYNCVLPPKMHRGKTVCPLSESTPTFNQYYGGVI